MLGELVPPLDLPTGEAGVPPPRHAVVAGRLDGFSGGAPDVLEESVLEVPLLPLTDSLLLWLDLLPLLPWTPHLSLHGAGQVSGWSVSHSQLC